MTAAKATKHKVNSWTPSQPQYHAPHPWTPQQLCINRASLAWEDGKARKDPAKHFHYRNGYFFLKREEIDLPGQQLVAAIEKAGEILKDIEITQERFPDFVNLILAILDEEYPCRLAS